MGVLVSPRPWKEDDGGADQDHRRQAERISREHGARRFSRVETKPAMHQQGCENEIGNQQEGDDEGRREHQGPAHGAVLGVDGALEIALRDAPAHLGKQHRAGRDADHADRQLVKALGVVDRGHRALAEKRRQPGVDEDRDLKPRGADRRGAEPAEEALEALVENRPARHARARPPVSSRPSRR